MFDDVTRETALLVTYLITYKVKLGCLHCTFAMFSVHWSNKSHNLSRLSIPDFSASHCIYSPLFQTHTKILDDQFKESNESSFTGRGPGPVQVQVQVQV